MRPRPRARRCMPRIGRCLQLVLAPTSTSSLAGRSAGWRGDFEEGRWEYDPLGRSSCPAQDALRIVLLIAIFRDQHGAPFNINDISELNHIKEHLSYVRPPRLQGFGVRQRPLPIVRHCETLGRIRAEGRHPPVRSRVWKVCVRERLHPFLDRKGSADGCLEEVQQHRDSFLRREGSAPYVAYFWSTCSTTTSAGSVFFSGFDNAATRSGKAFLVDQRPEAEFLEHRFEIAQDVFQFAVLHVQNNTADLRSR